MNRMSKIHLWVGYTEKSKEEFNKYFEQKNAYYIHPERGVEKVDSELIFSSFSKDLNKKEMFDEDFLTINFLEEKEDLSLLLEEIQLDIDENLIAICTEKGIHKANAMFFYTDSELKILDIEKVYNGLLYIGVFDWF